MTNFDNFGLVDPAEYTDWQLVISEGTSNSVWVTGQYTWSIDRHWGAAGPSIMQEGMEQVCIRRERL